MLLRLDYCFGKIPIVEYEQLFGNNFKLFVWYNFSFSLYMLNYSNSTLMITILCGILYKHERFCDINQEMSLENV
jgi:hypothetical protein